MLGELRAAVDGLRRVDPSSLSDEELGALLVELRAIENRLDAEATRLTGEWDARKAWAASRARTASSWLAYHCRMPHATARRRVRLARASRAMPEATVLLCDAAEAYRRTEALAPGWYHCRTDGWLAEQIAGGRVPESAFDLLVLLESLPAAQKRAIALTKIEGLSVAEASLRCGVSVSALKVQVHRGLKRLTLLARSGS